MFDNDRSENIQTLDCLGDICPIPIMKLQVNLKQIQNGQKYMLVTDHSCTLTSVADFCKKHHFTYDSTEVMNGVWEIIISK